MAHWAEGGSGCGVTAAGEGGTEDDDTSENKSEPVIDSEPDREMFGCPQASEPGEEGVIMRESDDLHEIRIVRNHE